MGRYAVAIAEVLAFYAAWFACAFGVSSGRPLLGTSMCAFAVVLHLYFSKDRRASSRLVLLAGALGFAAETALTASGWLNYKFVHDVAGITLPPHWLVGLWAAFATLIPNTMGWLDSRLWIAVVVGGVFGPLAYYFGEQLGALTIAQPIWRGLIATGVVWAIVTPLLIAFHARASQRLAAPA